MIKRIVLSGQPPHPAMLRLRFFEESSPVLAMVDRRPHLLTLRHDTTLLRGSQSGNLDNFAAPLKSGNAGAEETADTA